MLLDLKNIVHRYPNSESTSLQSVSATIDLNASVTSILGASGCGKTTLLRCLAGHEQLAGGSLYYNEHNLNNPHIPPEKRNFGYVFQDLALFPHLNVTKNIAYGLHTFSQKEKRARVNEMLELFNITELAKRSVAQLSGGQQQRVALARAVAPAPKLLLLDEPFASLDPVMREEIREDLFITLRQQDIHCIMVTHDPFEALSLSDSIIVMHDGRILQQGNPQDIYAHPKHLEVLRLFGRCATFSAHEVQDEEVSPSTAQRSAPHGFYHCPLGYFPRPQNFKKGTVHVREDNFMLTQQNYDDSIEVLVLERFFSGNNTRYLIQLPNGQQCWVKQSSTPLFNTKERYQLRPSAQYFFLRDETCDET